MHPYLSDQASLLRREELRREASRAASRPRSPRRPAQSVRRALGARLVAVGLRLIDGSAAGELLLATDPRR